MTVAGIVAELLAIGLGLPQGFWAVVTALIVVQASLGGTLTAGLERMVGTLAGAALGAVVALARHAWGLPDPLALILALGPLAVAAASSPSFRVAPVTAAIILLGNNPGVPPLDAAAHRVAEIAIGTAIGIGVSLLVFPARAHGAFRESIAALLRTLADLVERHLRAIAAPADQAEIERLNARVRGALMAAQKAAGEASRERASRLTDAPRPDPLLRSGRRLRSDVAMLGRATARPLPAELRAGAMAATMGLEQALSGYLRAAADALARQLTAPALDEIDRAIERFVGAWHGLQPHPVGGAVPLERLERLAALPFALETLRLDLGDLAALLATHASVPTPAAGSPPATGDGG
jgi:uncharacterized membrane protein YccC